MKTRPYSFTSTELELIQDSLRPRKRFSLMNGNAGAMSDLGYRSLIWKCALVCAKSGRRKNPNIQDIMNSKKAVDVQLKKNGIGRDYGDF